jgi:putative endonuclease
MGLMARLTAWWTNRFRPVSLGKRGERSAERYLKRLGYRIVRRGERTSAGEIDLVAVDGRVVVFVEVKTRASHDAGHPAEAVDRHKQQRLTRLALTFLKQHDLLEHAARFDVVAITWPVGARRPVIEHYKNAFEPTGRGQMFG